MDTTVMNRWIGVSGERCTTQAEDDAMVLAGQLSDALARAEAAERELDALAAEVARLRDGGCARDQRLTQHCADAEMWRKRAEAAER